MDYFPRTADAQLRWLLEDFGGVLINGARRLHEEGRSGASSCRCVHQNGTMLEIWPGIARILSSIR